MTLEAPKPPRQLRPRPSAAQSSREITEWDEKAYLRVISTELTPQQRLALTQPSRIYPRQESVLAVHWHPEHIPLDLIRERVNNMFPSRRRELVIPTQHNIIMAMDGFAGVEVDCYSKGFNRKVQLLLHMREDKVEGADTLKAMLEHTFKYRSGQLLEFLETLVDPSLEHRLAVPAQETGANEEIVALARTLAGKLLAIIYAKEQVTPQVAMKNKLLTDYIDECRAHLDDRLINRVQLFVGAVKKVVKANFSLSYFYSTEEVIEEARSLGAGVVVPHPEQFWPILLADYDLDGYEVWNPQSNEYTEFLIQVVLRQNKTRKGKQRQLLIFMGDDTHMSEKAKEPRFQNPEKAGREIGVQTAWDDHSISKTLIAANASRRRVIEEYKNRLS